MHTINVRADVNGIEWRGWFGRTCFTWGDVDGVKDRHHSLHLQTTMGVRYVNQLLSAGRPVDRRRVEELWRRSRSQDALT
jgi:hypothetical protein